MSKPSQLILDGYRQPEVGVIPEDWVALPLSSQVAQLEAGVSVNSVDSEGNDTGDEPSILKTSAVEEGRFLPHECKVIANPSFALGIISPFKTRTPF